MDLDPWRERRRSVTVLLLLTAVAGALDAIAFIHLGGTFVSNQTGTVLLLAMNAAGEHTVNTSAAVVSFVSFVTGAVLVGRYVPRLRPGERRPRRMPALLVVTTTCVVASAVLVARTELAVAWVIAPIGFAMGVHAALAQRIAVPMLTTGYVTGSTTTTALSSPLGDRSNRWWWYGIVPIVVMTGGALVASVIADNSVTWAFVVSAMALGIALGLTVERSEPRT